MSVITDYRVNQLNDGKLISVEVKCCGNRIGELRFKNGASIKCPQCQTIHVLKIQHNHFHLGQIKEEGTEEVED